MIRYVAKRLLWFIPVAFCVLLLVFTISKLAPGDPVTTILGLSYTPEKYAEKAAELGLDKSFFGQLWDYIWNLVTRLDLGKSYQTHIPVVEELANRMPVTLTLGLSSVAIAVIVGIPLGILSAIRQYGLLDTSLTAIALVFAAVPGFVLALVLLMVFAGQLQWLPIMGGGADLKGWILPVASNSMFGIAIIIRMTRTTMLEVIRQDYIRTAKSKGLSEVAIIRKHALKNSMIPVVTAVGGQIAYILAGSIIVETIFSMPGVGMYLISGIQSRDYPVINGIVILMALLICLINLLVDIVYAFIDPRIKAQYVSFSKKRKSAKAIAGKVG